MGEMTEDLLAEEGRLESGQLAPSERPWNETNPEWWRGQVEYRGDIAWQWLVNEWAPYKAMAEALGDLLAQLDHSREGDLLEYDIAKARALFDEEWSRARMVITPAVKA